MDEERRSRIERIDAGLNARTILRSEDEPRIDRASLEEAWSRLVPAFAAIAPRDPSIAGFRIFWTRGAETGIREITCAPGAHLVVGRHSSCDVSLSADAELSLRHLLLVTEAARSDDEEPTLRLLDLMAFLPMYAGDDVPHRSLRAQGAFAVRLGRYVLGGFRIGPGAPPPPADAPLDAAIDAPMPPPRASRSERTSTLMRLDRPSTLIEVLDERVPGGVGTITATRRGHRVRAVVTGDQLDRGVLVGRADKCLDRGMRALMSTSVSRVHAVLIRNDGRTMIYDAASMNGTFHEGARVRSVIVGERGARVHLAGPDGIELSYEPLAANEER